MCCLLVSGFLTEITQQIHSYTLSGVISSHFARAAGSEMKTFRKSAGTLCTAPRESAFLVMDFSILGVLGCCSNWAAEKIKFGQAWGNYARRMGLLSASKREKILTTKTRQLAFSRLAAA